MLDNMHILGASGTGTTTLGSAIAARYGHEHVDTDYYYWEPTDPPFQVKREIPQRQQLLGSALDAHPRWVLSGSLCGWGDIFVPQFQLVIYLYVPAEVRLARLQERELQRYGKDALIPGGNMHETSEAFLEWAAGYEGESMEGRSKKLHERWLAELPCRYIRMEGTATVDEHLASLDGLFA